MPSAVVSVLPQPYYSLVEDIWRDLEDEFGLHGVYRTPYPHFSYHVADRYDVHALRDTVERLTRRLDGLSLSIDAVGIFESPEPVVFLRPARTQELVEFHRTLWRELEQLAVGAKSHYAPAEWVPHVTLAAHDLESEDVPAVVRLIEDRELQWSFTVTSISLIKDTGSEQVLDMTVSFAAQE